jgi:hypothetical protein
MPVKSDRETIEDLLLREVPHVRPLTAAASKEIRPHKNGSFARSVLGFMLYCNGHNKRGRSPQFPDGLFYSDDETVFGIGFFRKALESDLWHPMIVAPSGSDVIRKVENVLRTIAQATTASGQKIRIGSGYVRHLSREQYEAFLEAGYQDVLVDPWHPEAPREDETFNSRLIQLDRIIDLSSGTLDVKVLDGNETRTFRTKSRRAYQRFENFLERNQLRFSIEHYSKDLAEIGQTLVTTHFQSLRNPIGSTPEDYASLTGHFPSDDDHHFARIGYLERGSTRFPVMLFLGERTGETTVALYATFALRSTSILESEVSTTGFSAISQYAYLRVFHELMASGMTHVDLGGSETEDLDDFKRQLGSRVVDSYWVVRPAP